MPLQLTLPKKTARCFPENHLEQMEMNSEKVWQHGHEEDVVPDEALENEVATAEAPEIDVKAIIKAAPKSKLPKYQTNEGHVGG
jgi:hypothetical protein